MFRIVARNEQCLIHMEWHPSRTTRNVFLLDVGFHGAVVAHGYCSRLLHNYPVPVLRASRRLCALQADEKEPITSARDAIFDMLWELDSCDVSHHRVLNQVQMSNRICYPSPQQGPESSASTNASDGD